MSLLMRTCTNKDTKTPPQDIVKTTYINVKIINL